MLKFKANLDISLGRTVIDIDRKNLLLSSKHRIMNCSSKELRKRLYIKFGGESGLDYGGLGREW